MSKITVTTIAGATSGADANTVKIESGDDLVVNTDTLKVDATNNRIGIGNTSPDRTVSIKHASQAEVGFKTGSVSNGALIYYNDSENKLLLRAQESGERIEFQTGGTTARASITDNGICFGTDTAAANALDDYEEGTWTPTAGTNAGTISTAIGKYTKVGRVVYIVAYIESTGMSTSSSRTYGGLPFTVNNLAAQTSVDYQGLEWSNNSGGGIYFEGGSSNFVNNILNTFRGSFAATDNSRFQGFYFTD